MNADLTLVADGMELMAGQIVDLLGERDRARDVAVRLEQENALLRQVVDGLLQWAETQPGFDSMPIALGVPR